MSGGTAAICNALRDGRRQISGIERAGSAMWGPTTHDASPMWLEALERTQICEVDLTSEVGTLLDDPALTQLLFEVIHTRLETATRHLTTLGRRGSTERVTLFLAETAALARGPGPVHLPLSREDIADYLGLSAETVSRIFSKLKKAGNFRFLSPTADEIPDPDALARRLPVPIAGKPRAPMAALHAQSTDTGARCPIGLHTDTE